MMASMLFAAGSFIGIMQNSGMLTAMAEAIVKIIPASVGQLMPVLVGIISMPASLLFDPDSYYYGVMPVLASAVEQMGVNPIMIARASIIGQMTTGFPVSPLTGATSVSYTHLDVYKRQVIQGERTDWRSYYPFKSRRL